MGLEPHAALVRMTDPSPLRNLALANRQGNPCSTLSVATSLWKAPVLVIEQQECFKDKLQALVYGNFAQSTLLAHQQDD
jgi:hypothetical protein